MSKILPIFLPFAACGNKCIFCDQNAISGIKESPDILKSAVTQIEKWFNISDNWEEAAFFGGNFGALDKNLRIKLYKLVSDKSIEKIRFSTRPDTIDDELLSEIKDCGVTDVELGIQSLDDKVLKLNGRPYTAKRAITAVEQVSSVAHCGVQLMTGMFGQTYVSSLSDSDYFSQLPISYGRIYPNVVIKGTKLEEYLHSGEYFPTNLAHIILATAGMTIYFGSMGVPIIRTGLPIEEGFKENIAGGAFHESFGDIVKTFIFSLFCAMGGNIKFAGYSGFIRKNYPDNFMQGQEVAHMDFYKICEELKRGYLEDNQRYFEGQAADIASKLASASHHR